MPTKQGGYFTGEINPDKFSNLSDEEAKRFGAIKERLDLFETHTVRLRLKDHKGNHPDTQKRILSVMRDPGNTAGLLPVIRGLLEGGVEVEVLADGRGLEALKKNQELEVEELLDGKSPLNASSLSPDLLLLTHTTSEEGLENFLSAQFVNVPIVFVEDMYGSADVSLNNLRQREGTRDILKRIKSICVSDKVAKQSLESKWPELTEKIVVTGQPLYDRLATEDKGLGKRARKELGIKENEVLITFFGASSTDNIPLTPNTRIALEVLVKKIKELNLPNVRFIFRNHPRDLITSAQYQAMMETLGEGALNIDKTGRYDVNAINQASDIVVSLPFSTITYDSIFRRKPVVVLLNKEVAEGARRPVPAVESGAVLGVDDLDKLNQVFSKLIDPKSGERKQMFKNQIEVFPIDGKNTERTIEVIQKVLAGTF